MAIIDVAPKVEVRDESLNSLADIIHYPKVTLNAEVDTIILQEVISIVGQALTEYSQSGAVTSAPESEIRELIEKCTDEIKLDSLLAPIILNSGSSMMQSVLIDHANKLFYLALDNATDVAIDAFVIAQTAKANGKYSDYEKQGKVIDLFSCELSEWVSSDVRISKSASAIGRTAASVALVASVGAGLINASPAAAEDSQLPSIISNQAAVVQVIGDESQQSITITSSEAEPSDNSNENSFTQEPVVDFDNANDVAKGVNAPVKDEDSIIDPITMKAVDGPKDTATTNDNTQTRKENNLEAQKVEKNLTPNVVQAIARLRSAVSKKSLNELSISNEDVFSIADPFNSKKQLAMPLTESLALDIKTKTDILNAILANDKEVIAIFMQYYEDNPPSEDMLEIIKDASVVSFSEEEAQDLTDDQKLLVLFILHDLQTELMHEADSIYKTRYKAYVAKQKEIKKSSTTNTSKASYSSTVVKNEVKKLTRLSKEKQDNVAKLIIAGQNLMTKEGVDKDEIIAVIGQGILESGYLDSALADAPHYNIFGVKAGKSWTGKKVLMPTHEVVNGKRVAVMAYFRSYGSLEEALEDRVNSLGNLSFYKDARKCATSPKKYLQGLMYKLDDNCAVTDEKEPRYATADQEEYINNILSVIKSTQLKEIINESYVKQSERITRLKGITNKEHKALVALKEIGLSTNDITMYKKRDGENAFLVNRSAAINKLHLDKNGGYPKHLMDMPLDAVGTEYFVYSRECVDYVARRVDKDRVGIGMPRWGGRINDGYGGVAYRWIPNAKKDGIRVDMDPAVGSVMTWGRGGKDHVKFGHVAYVEKVLSDGSVVVSQFNNGGTGLYSVELLTKEYIDSHSKIKFVHFEEGTNSELPSSSRPKDNSY